jgi:carboxymethylenebutenolidase
MLPMHSESDVLTDVDGVAIRGAFRAGKPEALVIVPDVFGLNEQARGVGRRFHAEGFTTLVIDLLDGRVTSDPAIGFKNAQLVVWKAIIERIGSAVRALASGGGKVGIVGFGFGGAVALAAAAHIPELAGCVIFYGIPAAPQANLARITCKVQGHFGRFDKQVSNDRVDALEAKLAASGVTAELSRYHAEHFYFDETRKPTHSASTTELSFRRAVAFLKMELTGSYT